MQSWVDLDFKGKTEISLEVLWFGSRIDTWELKAKIKVG